MAKGKPRIKRHVVEWDGEKHRLAKPGKGIDIPVAEKVKIAKVICSAYSSDEYTLEECCALVGISSRTFFKWRSEIAEISQIYQDSDEEREVIYRHQLKQRGRTNVERLLDGFIVELEDKEMMTLVDEQGRPVRDENGEPKMIVARIKKRQLYIKPSVKLTETVLFNQDKKLFERNPTTNNDDRDRGEFEDWSEEQIKNELDRIAEKDLQIETGAIKAISEGQSS